MLFCIWTTSSAQVLLPSIIHNFITVTEILVLDIKGLLQQVCLIWNLVYNTKKMTAGKCFCQLLDTAVYKNKILQNCFQKNAHCHYLSCTLLPGLRQFLLYELEKISFLQAGFSIFQTQNTVTYSCCNHPLLRLSLFESLMELNRVFPWLVKEMGFKKYIFLKNNKSILTKKKNC